jgi:hypothetical protein
MPKSRPLTLAELDVVLPRIQATVEMLAASAAHEGRAAAKAVVKNGRRGHGRRKGKPGRPPAPLTDKLLKTLAAAKAGLPLGDIVKRVKASASAVQYYLRKLRAEKRAKVVGDRNLARWFATK